MSLLGYRAPHSFTDYTQRSRPDSNTSSTQALDSQESYRSSLVTESPTNTSVALHSDWDRRGSHRSAGSPHLGLKQVQPHSPSEPSSGNCAVETRGPLHPSLGAFQSSSANVSPDLRQSSLGFFNASTNSLTSTPATSPNPDRGSRSLKPLLLASKATRSQNSSRSPSPFRSAGNSAASSPRLSHVSLLVSPDPVSMSAKVSDQDVGPTESKPNGAGKMSRQKSDKLSRPVTAPDSPQARYSASRGLQPPLPRQVRRRSSIPDETPTLRQTASDTWMTPQDAEGDFVRRTYAHFAVAGVPDDGFSEGKEYTREKSGLPAWEDSPKLGFGTAASSLYSVAKRTSAVGPASRPDSRGEMLRDGNQRASLQPLSSGAVTPSGSSNLGIDALERNRTAPPSPAAGLATLPASFSMESSLSGPAYRSSAEFRAQLEASEKKREDLLSKIDRYGFFSEGLSIPSHSRTVVLPSSVFVAPLPRKGKKAAVRATDPSPGEVLDPTSDGDDKQRKVQAAKQARSAAEQRHRSREQSRIDKWSKMLKVTERDQGHNAVQHDFVKGLDKRVRRRVYKGIPDIWRAAAWNALILRLAETAEGHASSQKSKSGQKDMARRQATGSRRDHAKRYSSLLGAPSPHDVQIDLDVPRTISGHIMFHTRYGQGQRSLFHVLHAISLLCSDCGYCQGMGPIAATLLCYYSADQAYAAMVMLHNHYDLHSTFSPGFPGLVENFYVQDQLIKTYLPDIAAVLEEQMIVTSSYATKWYITLFANTVPFETHLRIWDAWLLDGRDLLTLVAVSIVWAHQAKILEAGADFETILGGLSGYFVPEDDDALIRWVSSTLERKDVRLTIYDARRRWKAMVESGESTKAIL